jgi:Ty5 Gag N-terminal region
MLFILFQSFFILFFGLLLLATIIHFGGYFYPRNNQSMTAISLFHEKEIINSKLSAINQYQTWHADIKKMVKASDDLWKAYYNDTDFINISLHPENRDKITFEFSDKYGSFNIQRNFEIQEKDFMSFLKIEDNIEYKKSHLRFLSALFYNHKKSVKREIKNFENLLDKQFGVSF